MSTLHYAGLSDVGCQRSTNQDRWGADDERALFIVADGVAGSRDGALAAQMAVELLPEYVSRYLKPDQLDDPGAPDRLRRAVAELSDDLYLKGQFDARVAGATTTVVAVVVAGSRALIAHLGDSRGYLFRDRQLDRLTRDHTLVQALIDANRVTTEEAAQHAARNVVIRFVAMPPPALPDVATVDLRSGDRILLCSDGLHGVVGEQDLAEILVAQGDPADACRALIAAARNAGGPDNITAVVVDVSRPAPCGRVCGRV